MRITKTQAGYTARQGRIMRTRTSRDKAIGAVLNDIAIRETDKLIDGGHFCEIHNTYYLKDEIDPCDIPF